jgi:hypothetical protein
MSRPILPWRSPLVALPPIGSAVWIRRLPFYDKPVRSTWSDTYAFNVVVPLQSDPPENTSWDIIPAQVHTWRFQFLADELAAFPPT